MDQEKMRSDTDTVPTVSFSVVVETENLGMAGIEDLCDTLDSLAAQTYPIARAQEVLVIAAGHVLDETIQLLRAKYPWITIHRIGSRLEYLQSKQEGARVATGDVVVFADSDVIYQDTWLENILYGFQNAPGATIVAGDTRIRGTSVYATAIQLVWMMDTEQVPHQIESIRSFYLNNFAIRRDVFLPAPVYPGIALYRAHTVEMFKQLHAKGYSAVRVPGARGWHLPPGNVADLWYRLLVYGSDAVAKTDFRFLSDGTVVTDRSTLRRIIRIPVFVGWKSCVMARRVYVLIREDGKRIGVVLLALPLAMIFLVIIALGCLVAVMDREWIFSIITRRETEHVV